MSRALSAAEVAERLGVSEKWLANMAAKRRIPHLLIARKYRFTEEHIAIIVAMFEVPTVSEGEPPEVLETVEAPKSRSYRNVE